MQTEKEMKVLIHNQKYVHSFVIKILKLSEKLLPTSALILMHANKKRKYYSFMCFFHDNKFNQAIRFNTNP